MNLPKNLCTYDIETAPYLAWCYGDHREPLMVKEVIPTRIISIAYAFGDGPVRFKAVWDFPDFKAGEFGNFSDKRLVTFIRDEVFAKAGILSGHNSDSFDEKTINDRLLYHKLPPGEKKKNLDNLKLYRKHARNASNKLGYLSDKYGFGGKLPHEGVGMFLKAMAGDKKQQAICKRYNKIDVERTRQLLRDILPFEQRLVPTYEGRLPCPECGSTDTQRRGEAVNKAGRFQRHQCRECSHWFQGKKIISKI